MKHNKNQVVFCTIKGSTIKKFLILDCLTGTSVYFALKIITSSILIGMLGSIACTETIKKVPSMFITKKQSINH
ncbi:hypothetical protein BTR25_21170 [Bacillus sp. MRMR6]|nr:hypothetical protein BTR25_21170 [Bacillus sp. MRMR6]